MAPPWLLELKTHQTGNNCAGQTVTQAGQAAGAQLLCKAWEPVFCGDPGYSPSIEAYMKRYDSFLEPTRPEWALPTLTEADLRSTVTSMASKAGGLDGWDCRALLRLPQQAWSRLLDVLENGAPWPAVLTHWKLVFIPKPNKGSDAGIPSALDTRPIAIGPVIYRAYARLRWKQVSHEFATTLHQLQIGGVGKHDAESLVCAILGEASDREYGVTLDFKKAFDSADWPLSLHLLQRVGTPRAVLNAVGAMWRQQQRWCTFSKCCDPSPVKNPLGLAQGDPWSPIDWRLSLAVLPGNWQQRLTFSKLPSWMIVLLSALRCAVSGFPSGVELF